MAPASSNVDPFPASELPMTVPTDESEKPPDDTSKLRMFLGILKKFIGVADIASVRFSLPSQLLEPTPNLEYWNYLDQPSAFVAIGDSEDELDRMLEVLRFWFTKDLKYVKGKPCKPYNSALGEFFRCNWDVEDTMPSIDTKHNTLKPSSSSSSLRSEKPAISRSSSKLSRRPSGKSKEVTPPPSSTVTGGRVRVSYLTEQTCHHPPVSAFYVDCPAKGLTARGFDQISAKFTGTSIRVTPGEHNLGIFITLHQRNDETYQLTHPAAHLGGLLRGSLSVTVGDQCFITCPRTKIKTILHYVEEGWLGRAQNKVEGVVFRYDPENDTRNRIKDIPDKDILCRIRGNWKDKIFFSTGANSDIQSPLIDLQPLSVAPKSLPPVEVQLPNESIRFWCSVTDAIKARQFSKATSLKQDLEEEQREKARKREDSGQAWHPRFFEKATSVEGQPTLTVEGREVLRGLQEGRWGIQESGNTLGMH